MEIWHWHESNMPNNQYHINNAITVIVLCGTKSCSVDTEQIPLTSMDVWPEYGLTESACIPQAAEEVEW